MARSIMFSRALLLLLSIAPIAISSLSLSPRAVPPSTVVLAISLATPLITLTAAENVDTVADDKDKLCKESDGNCKNDENGEAENNGSADTSEQNNAIKTGPNGDRLITADELALYIGKGGASPDNPIWLSILGKVYDVTTGEDFYGEEKGSYKYYAGRDASPCFSSGKNNAEGADEKLEEWEDKKLMSVYEWSTFYEDHETYKYLGILAGSRYYDESGNELEIRKDIIARASEAKRIADEERERKKKARQAEREKRRRQAGQRQTIF